MSDPHEEIATIRERYRLRLGLSRAAAEAALAAGDATALCHVAHKLSGSAGTFGFLAVAVAAEELEALAEAPSEWTSIERATEKLIECLDKLSGARDRGE